MFVALRYRRERDPGVMATGKPRFPISDELRDALWAAVQRKGGNISALAREAKCSHVTFRHIVNPHSGRPASGSALLPKICEVLEVELGAYLPLDEDQRHLLRLLTAARLHGLGHQFVLAATTQARLFAPDTPDAPPDEPAVDPDPDPEQRPAAPLPGPRAG